MGKVFRFNDRTDNDKTHIEIPDRTYVDERIKALQDALTEYVLGHPSQNITVGAMQGDPDIIERDMPGTEPIRASRIIQSAENRMISNSQLELFKRKPSLQQVKDVVAESIEDVNVKMNQLFSQLLNNDQALKRIRAIIELVNDDDTMSQFVNVLQETATLDDLAAHAGSHKHLTNTDRKALNLLLDAMKSGTLDAIAAGVIDSADHARNADTVNGLSFDQISGHHLEQVVLAMRDATPGSMYDVGLVASEDGTLDTMFNNSLPSFGGIALKPGEYKLFNEFKLVPENDEFIVNGSGTSTCIYVKSMKASHSKVSNMKFIGVPEGDRAILKVGSEVDFTGCTFQNMIISIAACQSVYFDKCKFIDCNFRFGTPLGGIYITRSLFDRNTKQPMYVGTGVCIEDNMNI